MTENFEQLYLVVFVSAAIALALLERVRVLQRHPVQIATRWSSNIGLLLAGSVLTAVVMPVGIYAFARSQPPGLISQAGLPLAVEFLLTFLFLDFWRYWEHRLFHRAPLLWRVHLVHHSDTEVDVTTTERHHPFEVLIGAAVLMALIAALGLPAAGVGVYLLAATVIALCSHANLRLPAALDRVLRWAVVTPAVHALHHSDRKAQTDSNYGSVLTLWDRIFGTYSDPERTSVRHFGLAYFHRPPDTGLARVLQQPFLFRRDLNYPDRASTDIDRVRANSVAAKRDAAVMTASDRQALLLGLAGCILVSVVMWPTWRSLATQWTNEPYQYAWLVLPMVGYLLATHQRSTGAALAVRPDFSGVAVVVLAAALWGAGTLTNVDVVRQFALVLALQGVAMSTFGWSSYRKLFPVLALLFLLIPAGDLLQPALLSLTVKSIDTFASLAQLPHAIQGQFVYIGPHRYIVADACSGLAYVTLATFLGYSVGCLLYRSFFRIAALAAFSAFLGVVCNIARVNAIVLTDWIRGTQMDLAAHGNMQWIALFATLLILFYVMSVLKGDGAAAPTANSAVGQATGIRRFAPAVAGASALLVAGSVVAFSAAEGGLPRASQHAFPSTILSWRLVNPEATWSIGPQGATQSLRLTFQAHGRDMHVAIVEALAADAKLSESNLVAPEEIWRHRQARIESGCGESACIAFVHATWERKHDRETRHAYYAYNVGDFTSSSSFAVRVASGWRRLTGSRDGLRLIGVVSEGADLNVNEVAATFHVLQSALSGPPTDIARAAPRD